MTTVGGWGKMRLNWSRSHQAFGEFSEDIPQPPELPTAQKRRHLFQSVSNTIGRAAQTRSHLYIVEDLDWADESTLALLRFVLTNRVAQLPVVIIGTYRGGYSENNPALVRTLEELIRMGVRPVKLGGLSKDDAAEMLRGLSQQQDVPESLVSLIFEDSQGISILRRRGVPAS